MTLSSRMFLLCSLDVYTHDNNIYITHWCACLPESCLIFFVCVSTKLFRPPFLPDNLCTLLNQVLVTLASFIELHLCFTEIRETACVVICFHKQR